MIAMQKDIDGAELAKHVRREERRRLDAHTLVEPLPAALRLSRTIRSQTGDPGGIRPHAARPSPSTRLRWLPRGSWTPSCRMRLRTSNGAPLPSNGIEPPACRAGPVVSTPRGRVRRRGALRLTRSRRRTREQPRDVAPPR
jgi:hypothetical protein